MDNNKGIDMMVWAAVLCCWAEKCLPTVPPTCVSTSDYLELVLLLAHSTPGKM